VTGQSFPTKKIPPQKSFPVKDQNNFHFPKPWPHAVNNSVIFVKKFTAVDIGDFRNNAAKKRSSHEHTNAVKNFVTKFLRCKWLISGNVLDDLA